MSFLEFADSKLKSFKNTLNSFKLDLNEDFSKLEVLKTEDFITESSIKNRWRELRRGMGKRTSGNKIMTSTYTADDIALAKSLERKGRYQWEIANILGRSESSVGNMLYKMRGQNNG